VLSGNAAHDTPAASATVKIEGRSHTGCGPTNGGFFSVGDWPPTASRWPDVEFDPNAKWWSQKTNSLASHAQNGITVSVSICTASGG